MSTLLEMTAITKTFPGLVANDHIDFAVGEGEIHALLGENGAGKTTLMRVLYGLYEKDSGQIRIRGKPAEIRSPNDAIALGIGMVHQEFMLVPVFTVAENVALGLETSKSPFLELEPIREQVRAISRQHGLVVDPDAKIQHLSIGVQQRVEIVKLLCRDARLLILDEPTAVLTPQEVDGLFAVLRSLVKEGRSVIFITHKLNEVMAICDRVTVLRGGKVIGTREKKDTDPHELAGMMVGREVLFESAREPLDVGAAVLRVQDIEADDDRGVPALRGVSFEVHEREIVGLAGVDGNGQSQLAETLSGLRDIKKGSVVMGQDDVTRLDAAQRYSRGLAYIPADRRGVGTVASLDLAQNCMLGQCEEFCTAGGMLLDMERIRDHARDVVSSYDVRTPGTELVAGKLSGGNLQKLLLGRELMRNPRILVVEQPTRGLDVGATEYVRSKILEARRNGAAVLLISAELDEILALSDRIAVIYEGRIVGVVPNQNVDIRKIGLMMAGSQADAKTPENIGGYLG